MKQEKIRVGVFGTARGLDHIRSIHVMDDAEVVAICEKDPVRAEAAKPFCSPDVKVYENFEQMISSGIDLVVLANYLPEHASCAIKALRKGVAVVSECLAAVTMKECVELVEAVEETGVYYSMAENSPYETSCLEMERVYQSGILGEIMYAEAEYNHSSKPVDFNPYSPTPDHWRKTLPRTYYLTHSLGPLMNMTRLMPKKVIGKVTPGKSYAKRRGKNSGDSGGIMLVEMENGVVFRVTGCTTFCPATHWFRLACEKGGIETVRTNERTVNLAINSWDLPEDMISQGRNSYYTPDNDAGVKEAMERGLSDNGHKLDDFRCVRNYIAEIREGRAPDMDVYRSVAMSAVAILGWRSVLDDSKQYDIPDFRDPAVRDAFREDDLSPWRGEIPWTVYGVE